MVWVRFVWPNNINQWSYYYTDSYYTIALCWNKKITLQSKLYTWWLFGEHYNQAHKYLSSLLVLRLLQFKPNYLPFIHMHHQQLRRFHATCLNISSSYEQMQYTSGLKTDSRRLSMVTWNWQVPLLFEVWMPFVLL